MGELCASEIALGSERSLHSVHDVRIASTKMTVDQTEESLEQRRYGVHRGD
jgi:hypothetical protein